MGRRLERSIKHIGRTVVTGLACVVLSNPVAGAQIEGETSATTTEATIDCPTFDEVDADADAIFVGVVEAIDDPIVDYRLEVRERGSITTGGDIDRAVTVFYSDSAPAALIGDRLRVRVFFSDGVATSNVTCMATTTIDDEPVEAATDALGAIGRSAGRVADRVGRLLLIGSALIFAATAIATLLRRLWPRLL